jgi:hypothetical protein
MNKTAAEIALYVLTKISEDKEHHPIRGALGALGGGVLGGVTGGVAAQSLPVGAKAEIHELAHPNKGVQSMMNNPAYPHLKNMNAKQRVSFRRGGIGGAVGGLAGLVGGAMLGS